jgi:hypothetical protein
MPQFPRSALLLLPALALAACTGSVDSVGGGAGPGGNAGPGPGSGTTPGGNGSGQQPGPGGGSTPGTNPGPGGSDPGSPPGTTPPSAQDCAPPPARIWALTPDQYVRTVQSLLPGAAAMFDGEGLNGALGAQQGFSNVASRLGLTEPYVGILLEQSYKLASAATATPAQLAPCLGQAARPADTCVRDFIAGFGARAFRRDLDAGEIDGLLAQFRKTADAGDARAGLRQVLMAVLTSPGFLFRTELGGEAAGTAPITLTAFETASALSFFLTDGPPDAQLLAAAREGTLGKAEQIEAHTRRLLTSAEQASGFIKFMAEHFRTRAVLDAEKDAMLFPEWKPALATQLAGEADGFVRQVVWGDGKLATLLSSPSQTAASGPRAGLFTQRGIQAALAKDNDTDAVGRGLFLREVLLCQNLPPPPENLNVVPPPPDGQRTMRERLANHSADPTCAVCHNQIDPLGLAFEIYDGLGRHRTTDLGKPVDTAGTLTGAAPEGARFTDGIELMKLLAGSSSVQACFVATMFRYAHGREPGKEDACTIDRLSQRFGGSGGNIVDLAVAITTDQSFIQRRHDNTGAIGGAP